MTTSTSKSRCLDTATQRRTFLKRAAQVMSLSAVTPYLFSSEQPLRAQSPSDRLRVGCIGVGGMGRGDATDFTKLCDVVAICDVDSNFGIQQTLNRQNIGIRRGEQVEKPDTYEDYQKILARDDIDIVSISTVDHWHVKIAIEALQARKHVFCQKPLTLTLEEGQLIRNAAKKYSDRVFQIGSQQRSQRDQFATACLMVRKGLLGDIKKMTVDIGSSEVGGPFQKIPPPASLKWEKWLGQAPRVDYIPQRCHGNFRWWYEYSGGKFTDWGAHHIDFVHWALGEDKAGCGPVSFTPIVAEHPVLMENGYPTVDDRYNTCNRFEISCKFASGVEMLVCSHSSDGNGILIEGSKGKIHVNRDRIKGRPMEEGLHKLLTDDDFKEIANGKNYDGWHKQNFVTCIREGGLPISDVYSHVQAMNSCHLCGIAARLNREIKWNPQMETFVGDEQAATFFARTPRKGYEIPQVS